MNKIQITLKSDLCMATGYSHGGVIDGDISYDSCGIPYIPARRIKGCLRECAELLCVEEDEKTIISNNKKDISKKNITKKDILDIFGEDGKSDASGIIFHNAYVEDYDVLYADLKKRMEKNRYLTCQKVLEQYTVIKAQTRIKSNEENSLEDGVADDDSLRYIRVVQHYSPIKTDGEYKELVFIANIECVHNSKEMLEKLQNICNALRHIGLSRNRGLGNIRCKFIEEKSSSENGKKMRIPKNISEQEDVEFEYVLENQTPIVLTARNNNETEKYISGQTILGALAGMYMRKQKKSEQNVSSKKGKKKIPNAAREKEEFERLFLSDDVIYSNLYLAEKPNENDQKIDSGANKSLLDTYNVYYPAPFCIGKYKLKDKCGFLLGENDNCDTEDSLKSLRGKFLSMKQKETSNLWICEKKDPQIERIYHHICKEEKKVSKETGLYMHDALASNQLFYGTIKGKMKDIRTLMDLLSKMQLRIGKSKTAQYGLCKIVDYNIRAIKENKREIENEANKKKSIFVVLRSDALLINKSIGYSADFETLDKEIRESIDSWIKENKCENGNKLGDEEKENRMLGCKIISGYYTKWNLQKQSLPVITAGTTVCYSYEGNSIPKKIYIGEKKREGLGECEVFFKDKFDIESSLPSKDKEQEERQEQKPNLELFHEKFGSESARQLCEQILFEQLKEKLLMQALKENNYIEGNGSDNNKVIDNTALLGRVMLMLENSLNTGNSVSGSSSKFENFNQRIKAITDEEKRNKIINYIQEKMDSLDSLESFDESTRELSRLLKRVSKGFKKDSELFWDSYLRQVFMHWRYDFKQKRNEESE